MNAPSTLWRLANNNPRRNITSSPSSTFTYETRKTQGQHSSVGMQRDGPNQRWLKEFNWQELHLGKSGIFFPIRKWQEIPHNAQKRGISNNDAPNAPAQASLLEPGVPRSALARLATGGAPEGICRCLRVFGQRRDKTGIKTPDQ
ncbi:hypothetical protein AVEN_213372-1 [Araneus ventricosus]|uniref:Uncharacterized protein n=1 Tax=Araneus ventricosus TaxID=182803 RepID=A0A4Y2WRH1_ARAVE|nr:hypothetical protein AVEN_17642-1 [Araneus ventricosus]GBO39303.1 hypothetical protein AVEN_47472-1 [Araneus ventricosus]GBO39307.1 hypothetical protein AVEN_207316-1 [Araneus ventricosus]GBO39308.1 hypothetical protein AVEN_213372-1 [Araneus ventricosus]